jgi:hypothetical protein
MDSFTISVPAGKLGLRLAGNDSGKGARVESVSHDSPLVATVQEGMVLKALDAVDLTALSLPQITELLAGSAERTERVLAFAKPVLPQIPAEDQAMPWWKLALTALKVTLILLFLACFLFALFKLSSPYLARVQAALSPKQSDSDRKMAVVLNALHRQGFQRDFLLKVIKPAMMRS